MLRRLTQAVLRAHGFKWLDPPEDNGPVGTEFAEGLDAKIAVRRGAPFVSSDGQSFRVAKIQIPFDIRNSYVLVHRVPDSPSKGSGPRGTAAGPRGRQKF